jgi:hypothetical protein
MDKSEFIREVMTRFDQRTSEFMQMGNRITNNKHDSILDRIAGNY